MNKTSDGLLLDLLIKNYSKKKEDKLTNEELNELLKCKSLLSKDEWHKFSERAKAKAKQREKEAHKQSAGNLDESAAKSSLSISENGVEMEKDDVSEGEIPVGPRKRGEKEDMKKHLDLLQTLCGVNSYPDIYSVLQKALSGYQQLLATNDSLQREVTFCKRKTKKLYAKVIELHHWRSSVREKLVESNERLLVIKSSHSDLRKAVNYNLQAFRAELADFSANFPKLLEISPNFRTSFLNRQTHSPTPNFRPFPPTHHSPAHLNHLPHTIPAHSPPHFIPSFYTPIPPQSPAPNWPTNFTNPQYQTSNPETFNNLTNSTKIEDIYSDYNNLTNNHYTDDFTNNTIENNNYSTFYDNNSTISRQSSSRNQRDLWGDGGIVEGIKQRARLKKTKRNNQATKQSNVLVYARICPIFRNILNPEKTLVVLPFAENSLIVARDSSLVEKKSFYFEDFFPADVPNQEMAQHLSFFPVCPLDGRNACIFTFGECTSGKTWTMNGTSESMGLMDRLVEELLNEISNRQNSPEYSNFEYSLRVSAANILFDAIDDTIATMTKKYGIVDALPHQYRPMEHSHELTSIPLSSFAEFLDLHSLVFDESCYNHHHLPPSSSSLPRPSSCVNYRPDMEGDTKCQFTHRVVIVHVEKTDLETNTTSVSFLTFVDLAGFETISKSPPLDEMRKKTRNANVLRVKKDLHSLSDILISLKGNSDTIPYRRCKLANFLKAQLDPQCQIGIIATVLASVEHYEESIDTLSFANKIK